MRHVCLRRVLLAGCCLLMATSIFGLFLTNFAAVGSENTPPVDVLEGLTGRRLLATKVRSFNDKQLSQQVHTSFIKLEGVDSIGNDMFVVYAASVPQLKAICTALPDCEGFNSDGWIKSRVSGKRRATIDLYLKQTAVVTPESQSVEDHSAGVFQSHLADYNDMERNLRIYVYESKVGTNMPSLVDYKYGVEYLFISLLAKSKFRTMDPDEATFFFIPSRCTAYRKSVEDLAAGIQVAMDTTGRMVEQLTRQFPYWNASLGADHFYICAHDMGTEVSRFETNLWKNAIGLVNTADYLEPTFIPHKDISLPPHPGRGTVDWSLIGQGGAAFDPTLRNKLAFMAGHPGRGVRPMIYRLFANDQDFHLVQGYISDKDYHQALKTTKFCLCPRGNKAWSPRIMDALWFGCIPVIIADHYVPPLHSLIPWDSVSVSVPEIQISDLKRILLSIPDQRITELQLNIQKVYGHLTWSDPPQPYDAFHLVLFELWQRRHVRRTHLWQLPKDSISYSLV